MNDLRDRVVKRWVEADVRPFQRPAPGPSIEIAGKRYALSDDGGPLGSPEDEPSGFGARLIRGPSWGAKKYLWVYDTDRQVVAMWRATDGNEKVYDSARSEMVRVIRLDKKGQIHRVSHDEFRKIETAMRKREAENLKSLQEIVERDKTTFQREVDKLTQEFFERHVEPLIKRAVSDIDSGATPIGFKPHSIDLPARRQMVAFVMGRIMGREFTPEKIERYLKQQGLDPEAPGRDNQAAYWAVGDVQEKAFEKYL